MCSCFFKFDFNVFFKSFLKTQEKLKILGLYDMGCAPTLLHVKARGLCFSGPLPMGQCDGWAVPPLSVLVPTVPSELHIMKRARTCVLRQWRQGACGGVSPCAARQGLPGVRTASAGVGTAGHVSSTWEAAPLI